ncbi:MAG TPA: hypothetical protein VFB43_20820 [Terracidiphilus sp.]|nr:hypothetical protein [Terracidiphilus sp.]
MSGEHGLVIRNTTKRLAGCFGSRFASYAIGLVILLTCLSGWSQSQPQIGQSSQMPSMQRGGIPADPNFQSSPFNDPYNNPTEVEKRLRMINAERQKAMVSDTDKLVRLATELNEDIAKSNSGQLSPAQLRKVAEIEKLAHSVRDKMLMSVRGPQLNGQPFNIDGPTPYFPSHR